MSDLRELYQELIIDHSKRPRNFRVLEGANRKSDGYNPLCGDKVTVFLELEGDRVKDIGFQGTGCAISTASASVMTESLKGKSLAQVEALFDMFHQLVTGKPPTAGTAPELGKLAVFSGVSEFPARVKCATLAWHTLHAAIQGQGEPVSTE
jgi:nitrogen fixation NifU-like protein